jgi:hypothetical protein
MLKVTANPTRKAMKLGYTAAVLLGLALKASEIPVENSKVDWDTEEALITAQEDCDLDDEQACLDEVFCSMKNEGLVDSWNMEEVED